jgi:hypothetical protein
MNKELKINCEFYPRAQLVKDPVIIDGFSRSGKFLLGHLVGAMDGLEFMQNPPLLETALYLTRLNKLELETARILVQTDIDMNTYNMAIGRGLNSRVEDSSCIYKAVDFGRFIARTTVEDPDKLINEFQQKKLMPLYIGHECLCNARALFHIYPDVHLISLQRDPLALIMSWYKRGWGRRFGVDPKSLAIAFKTESGPVPWFGLDWMPEYASLSEMDRIVKSMEVLSKFARQEYELLTAKQKSQIHFVAFESILSRPTDVINGISCYLNRLPHPNMSGILARERVPRAIPVNQRVLLIQEIRNYMSPSMGSILEALIEDFDCYWMNLVERQT